MAARAASRSRSPPAELQLLVWDVALPGAPGARLQPVSLAELRTRLGAGAAADAPADAPAGVVPVTAICRWDASDAEVRGDAFRLADKAAYPALRLEARHATARCARCCFDEATHVYTVDGLRVPWSGTTFSHLCEHAFDAEATLDEYYSEAWAQNKGHVHADGRAFSRGEVAEEWRGNGEQQSRLGTLMHWHIECHLNGYVIAEPRSPEFRMYLDFEARFLRPLGLEPWRTEMNLFHCGLRLAGQADLVCRAPDGRLAILDWKRSREIKAGGFRGRRMQPPLEHLPDCNLWTYCLQLNTYRHMLESEYELPVGEMFIVVLHPGQLPAPCGAHVYRVPRLEAEISALVAHAAALHGTGLAPRPGPQAPFELDGLRFAR